MALSSLDERYINFYTDFAFKKLFGTEVNKDLLISFLNSMFDGKEVIRDLTYLNSEQLGTGELDRKAVFDVYCENEKGEKFLVEMQKAEQQFFKDRSVFYSTFPIRDQAVRGNSWDYNLKTVYTIGILNFCFDDTDPEYFHHEVKLIDTKTGKVFFDKLVYVYLEMPKFTKTETELTTLFDKWLYAIRHLATLFERPAALQEKVFQRLFEVAEIAKFNRQERLGYEESLKIYRDWYSIMTTAEKKGLDRGFEKGLKKGLEKGLERGLEKGLAEGMEKGIAEGMEKGMEKGLAEGMEKGRIEEKRTIARSLLNIGMTTEQISATTGLTEEEIRSLI